MTHKTEKILSNGHIHDLAIHTLLAAASHTQSTTADASATALCSRNKYKRSVSHATSVFYAAASAPERRAKASRNRQKKNKSLLKGILFCRYQRLHYLCIYEHSNISIADIRPGSQPPSRHFAWHKSYAGRR